MRDVTDPRVDGARCENISYNMTVEALLLIWSPPNK